MKPILSLLPLLCGACGTAIVESKSIEEDVETVESAEESPSENTSNDTDESTAPSDSTDTNDDFDTDFSDSANDGENHFTISTPFATGQSIVSKVQSTR